MNIKYMKLALNEAKKAYKNDEIPIGAVIVKNDEVIAKAYNKKEKANNPLGHAEIYVIEKASKKLNNWRLNDCEIYITLEPCPMCASAIKQARIKKVYIGTPNKDQNNLKIIEQIFETNDANGVVEYNSNILEKECSAILEQFFKNTRKISK